LNSEGFRETFLRSDREGPKKAKMAGKKEAKQKAGPSGQTEKNREETESSKRTKNTSKEGGQSTAQKKQPQAKREQRPEEGAQGQRRVDEKDLQEDWETIKEIDRVLGHLEGRLDKVTAVIRQVAVQGKALELVLPEEDADGAGSGESSGELEVPALQSSMEEHRIVDIQEPRKMRSHPPMALRKAIEGRTEKNGRRWKSKEDGPKKNMTSSEA
jgi:hypothetical protein